ncbi:MAG TPA: dihydroorotate dehydrogenase-like protein [Elusimicrobia bacterium]|nr:dihydroorotate dehydrogenase-like protein [Elusimicrobiota bacterium]
MDLSAKYLGLKLKSPIVPAACPLGADLDALKKMEEAGAGAVVLPSLFEEQMLSEEQTLVHYLTHSKEQTSEALSYLPEPDEFHIGAPDYADHVRKAKKALSVPVIASLNAATPGGWVRYAREIEQAGADALELNLYHLVSDPTVPGSQVEASDIRIVREACARVKIPVAVKVSPFYSAIANVAAQFVEAGARGLVLFNRFHQPDINLDKIEARPAVNLSTSADLSLPLRWTAILHGRVKASLAVSSGVHTHEDALKAVLVGADAVCVCSELLTSGIGAVSRILKGMRSWMERNEYSSIEQMKGSLSHRNCPDPEAFERAHYVKALSGYHLPAKAR